LVKVQGEKYHKLRKIHGVMASLVTKFFTTHVGKDVGNAQL